MRNVSCTMGNQKVVQEALYWAQHAPVSTRSFQAEHGFGCPAVGSQRWEWLKCLEHPEQQRQIKTKIQLSEKQLIFTHFSFMYHLLNSACQHHMLCTASRWKIKFVMFLISNAPSFLASSCFHAVACTRLQLQKALCVSCGSALCPVSCVLWLFPVPQPPLCPGLLLLVRVGGSGCPPMFLVAMGLTPCCWTEQWEPGGAGAACLQL